MQNSKLHNVHIPATTSIRFLSWHITDTIKQLNKLYNLELVICNIFYKNLLMKRTGIAFARQFFLVSCLIHIRTGASLICNLLVLPTFAFTQCYLHRPTRKEVEVYLFTPARIIKNNYVMPGELLMLIKLM